VATAAHLAIKEIWRNRGRFLLFSLAALLTPTSGRIIIDGQDLAQMNQKEKTRFRRRKIGFTFQDNNLVSYLSVIENVELMLRLNGEFNNRNRKRARDLLVLLGLEERWNALPR